MAGERHLARKQETGRVGQPVTTLTTVHNSWAKTWKTLARPKAKTVKILACHGNNNTMICCAQVKTAQIPTSTTSETVSIAVSIMTRTVLMPACTMAETLHVLGDAVIIPPMVNYLFSLIPIKPPPTWF